MQNTFDRKQAIRAYKERDQIGGLYHIINTQTGWASKLFATPNMQAEKNKLQMHQNQNLHFEKVPREEWERYGSHAFILEEVELLKKTSEQSPQEFKEDLAALLELHAEQPR